MSDDKNVRDWDRLLLRVPDGLKEALTRRAVAKGRSVNTEAVAILAEALNRPDEMGFRELEETRRTLSREEQQIKETLTAIQQRLMAINDQLMSYKDRK